MATVKVFSLLIKTLSKPIASRIKSRAQEHPHFRKICVGLAQSIHRYETRLASGIFAKVQPTIRPLSDTKAIQNGANFISEAFLFTVALGLIVGENLRGRIQTAHRRDQVNDRLEELEQSVADISSTQLSLKEQLQHLLDSYEHGLETAHEAHVPLPSHTISRPATLTNDELVKEVEIAIGWRST
ncbi:hypothetical protein CROQUDRAFT_70877 [Cronartium quercuum f. sp. fusiforme G11]|uniref:OPA3-like protein n=1 Tax=Cronartium quercuum f. sp. fusiforme G11 TaxID=708437 RepID=A0A9P6TH24_9BASI|nr:hypothetical protein CROQUDRAFT_70877 [Cronartium quercuum f. sp. fusiforme G11]